jgi:hypothetical protein
MLAIHSVEVSIMNEPMGSVVGQAKVEGVDMVHLRAAIAKDLELIEDYAAELFVMVERCRATVSKNIFRIRNGQSVANQASLFASDLDMQASRVARRIDHMQALVEVAYLAEACGL